MRDAKKFFRESEQMFEELREEREARRARQSHTPDRATRREAIATALLAARLSNADFPWLATEPEQIEKVVRVANDLMDALDRAASED